MNFVVIKNVKKIELSEFKLLKFLAEIFDSVCTLQL